MLALFTPAGDERCEADESLIINALGQMQLGLSAQSAHSHNSCIEGEVCMCMHERECFNRQMEGNKRVRDCVISKKRLNCRSACDSLLIVITTREN